MSMPLGWTRIFKKLIWGSGYILTSEQIILCIDEAFWCKLHNICPFVYKSRCFLSWNLSSWTLKANANLRNHQNDNRWRTASYDDEGKKMSEDLQIRLVKCVVTPNNWGDTWLSVKTRLHFKVPCSFCSQFRRFHFLRQIHRRTYLLKQEEKNPSSTEVS